MPSKYPIIAGDVIIKIVGNIVQKANSGDITILSLSKELPADLINTIEGAYPVYATLGCRIGGLVEYVEVIKGGYNNQNKSLRVRRGQSPFASGLNGISYQHQSSAPNSIELNFGKVFPNTLLTLSTDVDNIKNSIKTVIQDNIPNASNSTKGVVTISYFNSSKSITEPYSVITNDNPLLRSGFASLLNITTNDSQLNFDQPLTPSNAVRLGTVSTLLAFFINTTNNLTVLFNLINFLSIGNNFQKFQNLINSQP